MTSVRSFCLRHLCPKASSLRRAPAVRSRPIGVKNLPRTRTSPGVLPCTCFAEPGADQSIQLPPRLSQKDVLKVRNLRHHLTKRDHPFWGKRGRPQGFVEEGDVISLRSVSFESKRASGQEEGGLQLNADAHVLPEWGFRAGPRRHIWFNPEEVSAAIVTTGGVCPGINVVVHNIVEMLHTYGVPEDQVLGIQYGFKGLVDRSLRPISLTSEAIQGIQNRGGSILGTSRESGNVEAIVSRLKLWELDMLFVVGGREGNKMVAEIEVECERQGLACTVVGVPKSMDNSILIVDRSFGFDSAVSEAQRALATAKVEAVSARNGIGLVKLMGIHSGFVAMGASMASGVVDVCLIPEVPFAMENVCRHVERILKEKQHCVICLADGAVNSLVATDVEMLEADEDDIGLFIKRYLHKHFEGDVDIKYIDPTYMIRAGPVTNVDRVYCKVLGQAAVDTAFSGITGVTVGMVNNDYVLLPALEVSRDIQKVNSEGRRWNRLKLALRQPDFVDARQENELDDADPWRQLHTEQEEYSDTF